MNRLVFVSMLLLLLGCGRPPAGPVQVATNVWPGYEPLYLARQLGALDPKAFRLEEMSSSSDCIRALRAGRVSAAALTLDETFLLLQDGVDLQVVLVMDVSHGGDALLGRPEIGTLSGVKGRRVGVENTGVGAYLFSRALDQAGLRPDEVILVPITEGAHATAYRSGTVDAIVTFEPTRSRLIAEGAKILFDSRRIPEEIFDVLVIRGEAARAHPEWAAQIRRAWFRALDFLRTHPDEAIRRMAPREGLEPAAFRQALDGLVFPDAATDQRMRGGSLLVPARRLADLMLQKHLLEHPVDPARLLSAARQP
ncbi:MAG TPA: ABC transporter substrate-binding protein [Geothrix sp.]|nr:ABC transporter substrate-binding protein [Geothrix sp.]